MSFDFANLKYRQSAIVASVLSETDGESPVESRLDAAIVLKLWRNAALAQRSENLALVYWFQSRGFPEWELQRACDLCASAEIALSLGDYVGEIVRPFITKKPTNS